VPPKAFLNFANSPQAQGKCISFPPHHHLRLFSEGPTIAPNASAQILSAAIFYPNNHTDYRSMPRR